MKKFTTLLSSVSFLMGLSTLAVSALSSLRAEPQVAPSPGGVAATPAAPAANATNAAVTPADRLNEGWWKKRFETKQNALKSATPSIAFLGDSITQGWEGQPLWKSLEEKGAFNLGYSGDRTEHVLWRIDHGEFDTIKPKVIAILIGTNNIGHQKSTPAQTVEGMKAILARLAQKQPQAQILIQAVFPRSKYQPQVDEINQGYAKLADGKKVHYTDFTQKFLNEKGELTKEVMPDLLHLSSKGYQIWVDQVSGKLAELSK